MALSFLFTAWFRFDYLLVQFYWILKISSGMFCLQRLCTVSCGKHSGVNKTYQTIFSRFNKIEQADNQNETTQWTRMIMPCKEGPGIRTRAQITNNIYHCLLACELHLTCKGFNRCLSPTQRGAAQRRSEYAAAAPPLRSPPRSNWPLAQARGPPSRPTVRKRSTFDIRKRGWLWIWAAKTFHSVFLATRPYKIHYDPRFTLRKVPLSVILRWSPDSYISRSKMYFFVFF